MANSDRSRCTLPPPVLSSVHCSLIKGHRFAPPQLAYIISIMSHYSTVYFHGGRDVFPIWLAPRTMLGLFLRPAVAAPGPRLSVIDVLLFGGLFLPPGPVRELRGEVPGEFTGEGIRLTFLMYGAALCSFFRSLRTLMLMRRLSVAGAGEGVSAAPLLRAADDAVGSISRDDTEARKLGNCFNSPRGAPGRRTGRPKPKPAMERFIGDPSCTDVLGEEGGLPFRLLIDVLPSSMRFFFHSGIESAIGDAFGSEFEEAEDGGRGEDVFGAGGGIGAREGAGGGGAGASSLTVNGAGVEQTRSLLAGIGLTVSATSSHSEESSSISMLFEVSFPCCVK